MIERDELIVGYTNGTIIQVIAHSSCDEQDALHRTLSELHNAGKIDFLNACKPDRFDNLTDGLFFRFQHVFSETLPALRCAVSDAANACAILYERAGDDLAADRVYRAFHEWILNFPQMIEQGLSLIMNDTNSPQELVSTVLLAGAQRDLRRFTNAALDLSYRTQEATRLGATIALGAMPLRPDDQDSYRIFARLNDLVRTSDSDVDAAAALRSSLRLLDRMSIKQTPSVDKILLEACRKSTPIMRLQIVRGLTYYKANYTESMIDSSFAAIQNANSREPETIRALDAMLHGWDIDQDRHRVFCLLRGLLGNNEHSIDLESLSSFRSKLREQGTLSSWYIVSMFLTGVHSLCAAASRLLRDNAESAELDIDLAPFKLGAVQVLYLARKVVGYCLANKSGSSALLLACLEVPLPDRDRACLEHLILEYLLLNYPTAIKYLEDNISGDSPTRASVTRLSRWIGEYIDKIRDCANCRAFEPDDLARQLYMHQQNEKFRNAWKTARGKSVLLNLIPRSTVLYGTHVISRTEVTLGSEQSKHRQELPLSTVEHTIETPRLEVLDPVRLSNAIYRFRAELPPS